MGSEPAMEMAFFQQLFSRGVLDEFGAEDVCRVLLLEIRPGEGLILALLATLCCEQGLGVESYLTTEDCDWDGVAGLS